MKNLCIIALLLALDAAPVNQFEYTLQYSNFGEDAWVATHVVLHGQYAVVNTSNFDGFDAQYIGPGYLAMVNKRQHNELVCDVFEAPAGYMPFGDVIMPEGTAYTGKGYVRGRITNRLTTRQGNFISIIDADIQTNVLMRVFNNGGTYQTMELVEHATKVDPNNPLLKPPSTCKLPPSQPSMDINEPATNVNEGSRTSRKKVPDIAGSTELLQALPSIPLPVYYTFNQQVLPGWTSLHTLGLSTYTPNSRVRAGIPATLDRRELGQVTPVRNQGSCGSCWAFSTSAALETAFAFKHGLSLTASNHLSPQYLIDCVPRGQGTVVIKGCFGGWPESALEWLNASNSEFPLESSYAYTMATGTCRSSSSHQGIKVGVSGWEVIAAGKEDDIAAGVYEHGAVVVIMDFTDPNLIIYDGSAVYNPAISGRQLSHAITVVGYTEDAWIIKNSFGERWGDCGYFYVKRGRNIAGIAMNAVVPVLTV